MQKCSFQFHDTFVQNGVAGSLICQIPGLLISKYQVFAIIYKNLKNIDFVTTNTCEKSYQ